MLKNGFIYPRIIPQCRIFPIGPLESRLPANIDRLLSIFSDHNVKATMFWLGWIAKKYPALVRQCEQEGHEIASHGYGHILAYKVARQAFREDICRAKRFLKI